MSEEGTPMILITVERFNELEDAELKLESLYQHGVDNWEGYSDSCDTYNEWRHGDE